MSSLSDGLGMAVTMKIGCVNRRNIGREDKSIYIICVYPHEEELSPLYDEIALMKAQQRC